MTYNCCDRMADYRTNQKSLIMSSNTKRKRLSTRFSMVIIGGFIISILLIIPSVYGTNCDSIEDNLTTTHNFQEESSYTLSCFKECTDESLDREWYFNGSRLPEASCTSESCDNNLPFSMSEDKTTLMLKNAHISRIGGYECRLIDQNGQIVKNASHVLQKSPKLPGNDCPVLEQERCDFNYKLKDPEGQSPDISVTSCRDGFEYAGEGSGREDTGNAEEFYCPLHSTFDEQKTWGICNGGCFEDDKSPKDFADNPTEAIFCKIKKTVCVFPFVYKDVTHNSCIKREDTFWCATKVNENDLNVIKGFWGKCDVDEGKTKCDPSWTSPEKQTDTKPMVAEVKINEETFESGVSANIIIEETENEITIKGTVKGLPTNITKFGFHIHEDPFTDNDCTTAGTHFNPTNSKHGQQKSVIGILNLPSGESHIGDLGNIEADENGEANIDIKFNHEPRPSLFEGETYILGRTLVIHAGEDDLTSDGDGVGNAGARIACGIISKPSEEETGVKILIIILVVVAILIIAILICVLCYYCKRSKKNIRKEKPPTTNGVPDPVDGYQNGYKPKKALFDELSIPFIDASPAPSPKPGRSTDRLSFFHRSSSAVGSRGSLSDEDKC